MLYLTFSPNRSFRLIFLHLQTLVACGGRNTNFVIVFVMGLGGIVYLRRLHGQDLAAVAIGVNRSKQNLVDVECLDPYICPRPDQNHY